VLKLRFYSMFKDYSNQMRGSEKIVN
jgi:hypothetical protein